MSRTALDPLLRVSDLLDVDRRFGRPNLRGERQARGCSGAPTQITRPAPIWRAAAMARMPIGSRPLGSRRCRPR